MGNSKARPGVGQDGTRSSGMVAIWEKESAFRVGTSTPGLLFFSASVLSFVPCASLKGLELVRMCVCVLGRETEGWEAWGRGGLQGKGLSCSVCFLSPLSLSQTHLSLTVLSVPSLPCLSICLSLGREGKRGSHAPDPGPPTPCHHYSCPQYPSPDPFPSQSLAFRTSVSWAC